MKSCNATSPAPKEGKPLLLQDEGILNNHDVAVEKFTNSEQEFPAEIRTEVKAPPLRKSFAWTLAGNLVYAGCQWGMLSVLAKMGSPSVVGQFALGLAITAPVFMLTNLQLRAAQATDAKSEYEFGHYFTLRLIASLLGIGVVAGIALWSRYERTTAAVVMLVGVAKAVESMSDVANGLQQKHERLDQVAIGLMLKGIVSVTAFTTVYRMSHRLTSAVVALVFSWAAVTLFYDLRLASRLEGSVRRFFSADWGKIVRLVVLSAPLGLVMAMISLNINIPRYTIEKQLGHRELGIFAAMAYLVTAAGLIVSALGQSAAARLSRMFATGDLNGFKSLLWKLLLVGGSLGIVGFPVTLMMGQKILTLLYTQEYANHLHTLLIMVATVSISAIASFQGYGMTAARRFKAQVPIIVTMTISTATLSLLLVPRFGLNGAAIALLCSASIQAIGSAIVLRSALKAR